MEMFASSLCAIAKKYIGFSPGTPNGNSADNIHEFYLHG
jgi:hypothetical protein